MTKVLFLIGLSLFLLIFGKSQTNAEFSQDNTKVTDVMDITEEQIPIDSQARKLMLKKVENNLLRERRAKPKKSKFIKNKHKKIIKNEKKGNNVFVRKHKNKKNMKKKRKEKRRKETKNKKKKRKYKKNKGKKMKSEKRKQAKKHKKKKNNEKKRKKRKYYKKNKAKKKKRNKIKQVKKHKNNAKREMLSKQYCRENDLSTVGTLFKRFGVLFRRRKNQIDRKLKIIGNKKNTSKTDVFLESAEKIKRAVIYPFQPRCTKNITNAARKNVTDTYVDLLSCPSKIINACNNASVADESCSVDALQNITDSISTCFDDKNCLQKVNIEQLVILFKKCNVIISKKIEEKVKKLKKECQAKFIECRDLLDLSVTVLEKCVGGKPDNKMIPKHSEVVYVRKEKTSRQSNLLVQKMDIAEHGQIFTQTTTYDEIKNILKIYVPEHGHGINMIKESTTYLITQFNDKDIFDTEIMTVGKRSYISNVSIDIATITKFLKRDYNISNQNESAQDIPIKDTETIDSIISIIDNKTRAGLRKLEQELTADSLEVIKIRKKDITMNDRIRLKTGGTFKTNDTRTDPKTTTASPCAMTTKHLRFRKGHFPRTNRQVFSRQDCTSFTETYYLELEGSTCRYILKMGDGPNAEQHEILDHGVHTHARNVLCCNDDGRFANPAPCQCSYINQRWTTNFDECRMASQSTKKCCDQCTYQDVTYNLHGLTGQGNYGCKDDCLFKTTDGKRRCFSAEENPVCNGC